MQSVSETYVSVNRAFSKQSTNYDFDDAENQVLQDLRRQVYDHVNRWIKPNSNILELNAGTGIDAYHFAKQGHTVHATDLSDGMIAQINAKIQKYNLHDRLSCQQVSYDSLDKVTGKKFDYVFSNFGGLNCIKDLSDVTKNLPSLLNKGAYVTFVIMPPVCLWELLWIFKGHGKAAFRRFHKDGVMAHLEGEYFKTYYHSLRQIKTAFGNNFEFVKSEGLAAISPPPSRGDFPVKYPSVYRALRNIDSSVRNMSPFNKWADHIVVTFKYQEH